MIKSKYSVSIRIAALLSVSLGVASVGCNGESKVDATKIGETVGKNVTQFAQGVGAGVDNELKVDVELSANLKDHGLTTTIAKQLGSLDSKSKSISIYFISKQSIESQLLAKAFNAQGQEIGRATSVAKLQDDDARYVTFAFPAEMDLQLVTKYTIDSRDVQK